MQRFAGQSFTSASGSFQGSLRDVLDLPLMNIFERAVFISTMNAVLRYLGLVDGTVHCKNDAPKKCAIQIGSWIKEQAVDRVGLVGMQPALLEALVETLGSDNVMVSDLAEVGKVRYGVKVLDSIGIFPDVQRLPDSANNRIYPCERHHRRPAGERFAPRKKGGILRNYNRRSGLSLGLGKIMSLFNLNGDKIVYVTFNCATSAGKRYG